MSSRTPEPPESPGPAEPALAALGALLDRSLIQIGAAARDARTFDREAVRALSDLWDNGVLPLFRAATGGTSAEREDRARAALAWMVRLRPGRWTWVVEQGALAGHRIDALVEPSSPRFDRPHRDYRDAVRPAHTALTPRTVTGPAADLAADYALETATVRHVEVERVGTRLEGFLILGLDRRYAPDERALPVPAKFHVRLEDVVEVDVDTRAAPGLSLDGGRDEIAIGLGGAGVLRARAGSLWISDASWHLSSAGRRADALVPPREPGSPVVQGPEEGELEGDVRGAADFVRWALLKIRTVRYPQQVAHVPLEAYCRALEGAGRDILAAGALAPREREAAFRSLVTGWLRRGGADLAPDWSVLLTGVPEARELAREVREELTARGALPPPWGTGEDGEGGEATGLPERAEARMVSYTAESGGLTGRRDASAIVHLAVPGPEGLPWRMRVLEARDPGLLRARTEAFDGAVRVRVETGDREILAVGDDALIMDARAWDGLA
ncbi:hypothetical protein DFP74_4823 [Nocardiopsis sp. Huas11]|uniref:hypothetical protein n=1 Tax=Nocardiopsis sp. Huas11 TaxID=2183912 RepID=UPI000EB3A1EE|nr:hypothetical protein [Nocardiopsis sp. Huas11]RKS09094.1 hypothetical protein DFP74_4823 [Nocardiopsis sp. Huas11]